MKRVALAILLISLASCHTLKSHCLIKTYDSDGNLTSVIIGLVRDRVIGQGHTLGESEGVCGKIVRRSKDTGLSPEGGKTVRHGIDAAKAAATGGASIVLDRVGEIE